MSSGKSLPTDAMRRLSMGSDWRHLTGVEKVKTRIVCTIGPASNTYGCIGSMIEHGMNVARLNFSHGTHEYHKSIIDNVREYCTKNNTLCAIMLDTKGPEIRTGTLKDGEDVKLVSGKTFSLVTDMSVVGDDTRVAVTYKDITKVVQVGSEVLLDDGLVALRVKSVKPNEVFCVIENTGMLGERKGVNLPGTKVTLPAVTAKDMEDIAFGVANEVDFIAASFIRKPADVKEIRALLGDSGIKIISKIESQEGVDNFEAILGVTDAVMVARGDLGVEIPIELVVHEQKKMIRMCNEVGKPVITATQMLESMVVNPRPTRAEATDVGNAVLDGSDCVMLSGETAKGKYPVRAVQTMAKIALEAEKHISDIEEYRKQRGNLQHPIVLGESIASSAVKTAWDLQAPMIIALTESGATSRFVSKYRPKANILCVTNHYKTAAQGVISRAVVPFLIDDMHNTEGVVKASIAYAKEERLVKSGDYVVVTSGTIEAVSGATNTLRVVTVP